MIKLVDLLKELDIRRGQLPKLTSGTIDDVYLTFLGDFDLDDILLDPKKILNKSASEDEIDFTEIIDVDGYKLIEPINSGENTKYLIDPEGETWADFVLGSVDVGEVVGKPYGLEGGQITLTRIIPQHRGKGYGALMYYMVLVHYGNLFSDNILYEGSRNIWLKKIYSAADFFGAEIDRDFYIPLTFEDANNTALMKNSNVSSYLASVTPTEEMVKLKQYVGKYSLTKGEYGVYETSLNSNELTKLIDNSEAVNDLEDLLSGKEIWLNNIDPLIPASENPKAVVIRCSNLVVVVNSDLDILPI